MNNVEQTLSIIKPDAVERNLVEEIKNIFIKNNLNIKNSKKIHITKDEAAEFYKVHQSKPFYNDLCAYLSSGPIVVMILEGKSAVTENRKLMGATNPKDAQENTIRKLYGISIDKNSVHGSDSLDNAKKEVIPNLIRRLILPFYIPVISLLCSFLFIKNPIIMRDKFLIYSSSFLLLVFTELFIRYTGINYQLGITYIFLPFILLVIFYLTLIYKLKTITKIHE